MTAMTKQAVISIDLARMTGDVVYVPGLQLPRHDKKLLEQTIGEYFSNHLFLRGGIRLRDVQSNPSDPPDLTFSYDGKRKGLELSELAPENRLEKDNIILELRRDIISQLVLSEKTTGHAVQ